MSFSAYFVSAIHKELAWIPGKFHKHQLLFIKLFPEAGSLFERKFVGLIFQ
jgi:hypothetical protein